MKHYYELAEHFLTNLVSYPTVNGNEKVLAEYITMELSQYGFSVRLQPISEDRSNVIATYGKSDNRVVFLGI